MKPKAFGRRSLGRKQHRNEVTLVQAQLGTAVSPAPLTCGVVAPDALDGPHVGSGGNPGHPTAGH